MQLGLLSALVWLPIATGVLVLILGDRRIVAGKWIALIGSLFFVALFIGSVVLDSKEYHMNYSPPIRAGTP